MSKTSAKGAAFLQALSLPPKEAAPQPANQPAAIPDQPTPRKAARPPSRTGLKHIGGYFDREDVEKFAILRARLGLDNSQLIKLAVEELFRKHEAKRAFGDS
jgi:hypothetical protein